MSDTLKIGGFMARGAENQLRLVVVPGVPTLEEMDQWVWGMEGDAFPPKVLTLVVTYKP